MIPLFKSHYSIGRSILTLNDPSKQTDGGPDSIFSIALENNLKQLYLVEDSMMGFFDAFKKSQEYGLQLIFGYRFPIWSNKEIADSQHKLVAFAKNDAGCKALNKFYTAINTTLNQCLDYDDLHNLWSDDLLLAVPFYDSFLMRNTLYLGNCLPEFRSIDPIFLVENNGLPFDGLIRSAVESFAGLRTIVEAKSIFYKNRSDAEALQTYKIICNRSFGKARTLSNPNLDHFGSDEFCWESYLEHAR